MAVSACFYESLSSKKSMESCVGRFTSTIALWQRYREMWWAKLAPGRVADICYERLVQHQTSEFKKIITALGMTATQAQLNEIIAKSRAEVLRNTTQFDLHDKKHGAIPKVRDAGAHNYTQYGLSKHTIKKMDSIFDDLRPNACT